MATAGHRPVRRGLHFWRKHEDRLCESLGPLQEVRHPRSPDGLASAVSSPSCPSRAVTVSRVLGGSLSVKRGSRL